MTPRRVGAIALAALAVLTLALRFDTAALPEIGRYRDDAYYYFCVVRSLIDGEGSVVSAGIPTNGIHVGHVLALLPLGAIGGEEGLVDGARWLGLALLLVAAGIVGAVLRRENVTPLWAAIGGLSVLADARLVDEAQNGQETALACVAMAVLIATRGARAGAFTLAAVLAVAARSDLILVVAALSVVRKGSWLARAAPVAISLCAYAAWNLALAGHPLQDSAAPMPWLAHQNLAPAGFSEWLGALWWWGRPCLLGAPFTTMGAAGVGALIALAVPLRGRWVAAPLVLVAVAAAVGLEDLLVPALAGAFIAVGAGADPAARPTAIALMASAVALVALHWLVRWYPRDYYVVPFGIAGAWALARYGMAAPAAGRWLVVLVAVAIGVARLATPPVERPWQEAMYLAGRFTDRFVGPDAPIGSFNSGIVSWHRDGPVVNLDGVVARPSFDALREHRLGAYLDALGVEWVCDNPVQFSLQEDELHACGRFFGEGFDPARDLTEVARFVGTGADAGRPGTDSFRLYRCGAAVAPAPGAIDLGARPGGGRFVAFVGAEGEVLRARCEGEDRVLARAVPGVVVVLSILPDPRGETSIYTTDPSRPIMSIPR